MAAAPTNPDRAPLSDQEVRKVAMLARLALDESEIQAQRTRLAAVLEYIERLRAVDLAGVEPMYHPLESSNRLAPDEPGPVLPTEALMAIAPAKDPPFIVVPKVIGEAGSA